MWLRGTAWSCAKRSLGPHVPRHLQHPQHPMHPMQVPAIGQALEFSGCDETCMIPYGMPCCAAGSCYAGATEGRGEKVEGEKMSVSVGRH
eukprot:362004-Chlamydomonas_euryale.AAC.15